MNTTDAGTQAPSLPSAAASPLPLGASWLVARPISKGADSCKRDDVDWCCPTRLARTPRYHSAPDDATLHLGKPMRLRLRPELGVSAVVLLGLAVAALAIGIRWSHISAVPLDFAAAR